MCLVGLRTILCSYRTLFAFIDFKLLEKSLAQMQSMSFELQADGTNTADEAQQIEYDIQAYADRFAEDYCRNIEPDMKSQVAFIEKLEEATKQATSMSPFVDYCAKEYAGLNLFLPKLQGLTQDTYMFTTQELCVIYAQAITEIKEAEVVLPVVDKSKRVRDEPYGLQDFAKAL